MKKFALLLLMLPFLAACGTATKDVSKQPGKWKEKLRNGNGGQSKPTPGSCKVAAPGDAQDITLHFGKPVPARLAIDVNGVRKLNSCKAIDQIPPLVSSQLFSDKVLLIHIDHQGAFPTLPREVTFKITDMGTCDGKESVLIPEQRAALVFVEEFPNGPNCASRMVARVNVQAF